VAHLRIVNVINLRLGVVHVGAAFQPRLNGYHVRATSLRGKSKSCFRDWIPAFTGMIPVVSIWY